MMSNAHADQDAPPSARLGGLGWFAVYLCLALVIPWPLLTSITTHISYGHEEMITVPLLNLWTVWWNADRAQHWFHGYWDAPIFFPTTKTFLFSETQPTTLIVAPVIYLTGNRGLAYNAYQLLILALNGFSAHRLLRRLGHVSWLALCGGIMSQILPFVMWQFGVVQLTTLFGIVWTIHAVIDLCGTGIVPRRDGETDEIQEGSRRIHLPMSLSPVQWWGGIRLGLAFGLTYWLCNYWGLFLALLLPPSAVWFVNGRWLRPIFWQQLAIAAVVSGVMIFPFAYEQKLLSKRDNWQASRTNEMTTDLSAHWRDHTDVPWKTLTPWLEFPEPLRNNSWGLGGGGLKLFVVPVGLIASLFSRRWRWGMFVVTFGLFAFGLSLGPRVQFAAWVPLVGGTCPFTFLQQWVPGFGLIRSPFRFCLFVQLSTVWLAIEALDLLNPCRWSRAAMDDEVRAESSPTWISDLFGRSQAPVRHFAWCVPMILASLVIVLEAPPPRMALYELPSSHGIPAWVQWLKHDAEPNTAIACLPFPQGFTAKDYDETTVWMYWSTYHGHPLVNGYSGFFPNTFVEIKEALEQFVPRDNQHEGAWRFSDYAGNNPGLQRLNELPIRYLVVKRSFGTRDEVKLHPSVRFRWSVVMCDDDAGIDIYQLPLQDE